MVTKFTSRNGPRDGMGLVVLLLALGFQPACDCFFMVSGRVVECGTTTPLQDVVIAVHVDRGVGGRQEDGVVINTDAAGHFALGANDPCESWVTLFFNKDGFNMFEQQFKGTPNGSVEICLTPTAPAP